MKLANEVWLAAILTDDRARIEVVAGIDAVQNVRRIRGLGEESVGRERVADGGYVNRPRRNGGIKMRNHRKPRDSRWESRRPRHTNPAQPPVPQQRCFKAFGWKHPCQPMLRFELFCAMLIQITGDGASFITIAKIGDYLFRSGTDTAGP